MKNFGEQTSQKPDDKLADSSDGTQDQEKEYSLAWFTERAFSSLKKISEGIFDYSDSLLLYMPGSDEKYEEMQHTDNPYHEILTAPERRHLEQIAKDIVAHLPENFEYIDLGPGTEHKEQYIFDQLLKQGKRCVYRPVDISQKYLNMATTYAEEQGITTEPVQAAFEELPTILQSSSMPRFVSIGATYMNYEPEEILNLLVEIAGNDGYAFINPQIHDRVDTKRFAEIFDKELVPLVTAKLKLLGLDIETDIEDINTNEDHRTWCTLKKVTPRLAEMGLKIGDKLLLFQSLRPSIEKLQHDLDESKFSNYTMLDVGESFIGVFLEKPLQDKSEEEVK